jgi:hypothetical protein
MTGDHEREIPGAALPLSRDVNAPPFRPDRFSARLMRAKAERQPSHGD